MQRRNGRPFTTALQRYVVMPEQVHPPVVWLLAAVNGLLHLPYHQSKI